MRITDLDQPFQVGDYTVVNYDGNTAFIVCIDYHGKPETFLVWKVRHGLSIAAEKLNYPFSYILTNDIKPSRKTLREMESFFRSDLNRELIVFPDDYMDEEVSAFIAKLEALYPNLEECGEGFYTHNGVGPFICERYTNDVEYTGFYDSLSGLVCNRPIEAETDYAISVELDVEFNSPRERESFMNEPSNWFARGKNVSLNSQGCTIITIPLNPTDAKNWDLWETVCARLRGHAVAWDSPRCGMRVQIGKGIFNGYDEKDCIAKTLYLYQHFVRCSYNHMRLLGGGVQRFEECVTELSAAAATLGSIVLRDEELKNKVKNEILSKSVCTTNTRINVTNANTIEFRGGKASINATRIVAIVEWYELICKYVKRTPWQQISTDDFWSFLRVSNISERLKSYVAL